MPRPSVVIGSVACPLGRFTVGQQLVLRSPSAEVTQVATDPARCCTAVTDALHAIVRDLERLSGHASRLHCDERRSALLGAEAHPPWGPGDDAQFLERNDSYLGQHGFIGSLLGSDPPPGGPSE